MRRRQTGREREREKGRMDNVTDEWRVDDRADDRGMTAKKNKMQSSGIKETSET